MALTFPKLRVGEPLRYDGLSVFPVFSETSRAVEYRLSDEALSDQSVEVQEISEGGSVPQLLVDNQGDQRVLFLEGEELVGAKQNRVLNTTVLIPARSKTPIPVSCVEQGRWRYQQHLFASSGSTTPSKLRKKLKDSVSQSLKAERGHSSDQGEIWNEVHSLHSLHHILSNTGAMSDAFDTKKDQIAEFRQKLQYVDGASGLAVAIGSQVVSVDLFDKPSTCRKVWDRILSGIILDALVAPATDRQAITSDVEQLLTRATDLPWQPAPAVGDGQEYRAESKRGDTASALVVDDALLHGSIMAAIG